MSGRAIVKCLVALVVLAAAAEIIPNQAQAAGRGQPTDWQRFYHYPYIYYPQNFQRSRGSYDSLYYRYPANQRIPVYNRSWYNFYPTERPYHSGHHYILDVF